MCANNFGHNGRNLTKHYQGMWLVAGVIIWTVILQGVPLQNLGGQKRSKIGAIFDYFQL